MKGMYLKEPLNILSCAVQGRPGRSAYEAATDGGYTGTPDEFAALLAALPDTLQRLSGYNGRVDAILEYMGNQIADLQERVDALECRQ